GLDLAEVTGGEEALEDRVEAEGADAVLVQLARLVVEGEEAVLAGRRQGAEPFEGVAQDLRLAEQEGLEVVGREGARAVEDGLVEVAVEAEPAGLEGRLEHLVAA